MERLLLKFKVAADLVPQPIIEQGTIPSQFGVIYFGSTSPAMRETLDVLRANKIVLDAMRIRAFPFSKVVSDFIAQHEKVFVVEQNRDAQMHTLLTIELAIDPAHLIKILHYDGTPITARFIVTTISNYFQQFAPAKSRARLEKESS
jgi:2-oxoglutarate ferredoxin oxidoreductase subunit alpha